MAAPTQTPNRLIHEKSPYLLQHAYNPVDWYAWGDEAFAKSAAEDKPILLSIGYSTCHWCHVMEHESFENPVIADMMNKYFVCIKVDREERPDLDKVYMTAVQALTGSGGWPMTVFLTPDLKPFWGGTYFPPQSRYNRPGMTDILPRLSEVWYTEREKVLESASKITAAIQNYNVVESSDDALLTPDVLNRSFGIFTQMYDAKEGGFGKAPKFPRPAAFTFLFHYYARTKNPEALEMSLATLRKMYAGGMYDHLGGGFSRYSVDPLWRVPHFEKMLYDQAQLVMSYVAAFQITKEKRYADVANGVLQYVMRDMTDGGGAFYSAEDADSAPDAANPTHKTEGWFYLWSVEETTAILDKPDAELFNFYYGIEDTGNTISDPHGDFGTKNVLYLAQSLSETAKTFKMSEADVEKNLAASRKKLFAEREKRPRPHLDDKILAAWNGLMISGFARAAAAFNEAAYLNAAKRASDFILTKMRDGETGLLKRRYRKGEAGLEAHLDDYAFLVQGLIDLYEASLQHSYLEAARRLTETQLDIFYDAVDGGFFDTSGRDKTVLFRGKDSYDSAEPTGNSVAVMNLLRLSQLLGRPDFYDKAMQTLKLFSAKLLDQPHALPEMLAAYDFSTGKPQQIILAGNPDAADTKALLAEVHSHYLPNKVVLAADGGAAQAELATSIEMLKTVVPLKGKATAYICENFACQLPTADVLKVRELLGK
jgi:uncharacterized protein YyaL (SSP411 family)